MPEVDQERLKHLREQWVKRTPAQKDDLLDHLLKLAWPTLLTQNS